MSERASGCPGNVDPLLRPLIPGYLAARREDLAMLESALAEGAWLRIAGIGHRLAGSGGSYGFPHISKLGARLERAGEARDAAGARQAIQTLHQVVTQALAGG